MSALQSVSVVTIDLHQTDERAYHMSMSLTERKTMKGPHLGFWHPRRRLIKTFRDDTLGAQFEQFVIRDEDGQVHFANRLWHRSGPRFLDRCWPVCRPWHRKPLPPRRRLPWTLHGAKAPSVIMWRYLLASRRRWLPGNPLEVHQMAVEDAKRVGEIGLR